MGWGELMAWLRAMKRERDKEREAHEITPGSWANTENDRWWQEAKQAARERRILP